jgi:hypothetical protein
MSLKPSFGMGIGNRPAVPPGTVDYLVKYWNGRMLARVLTALRAPAPVSGSSARQRKAGGRKRGAPLGRRAHAWQGLLPEHRVGLFADRPRRLTRCLRSVIRVGGPERPRYGYHFQSISGER